MGGPGSGHKSVRARESRLVNIQKARAARKRAPLPWRSGLESRIIEQLVWQWWVEGSGQWTGVSGQKSEMQIPRRAAPRNDSSKGKAASSSGYAGIRGADRRTPYRQRPWAKYRVARFLGVSHTWVNKLVRRFEADPDRMRRKMAAFAPASIEKLEQAREETRRQRERGWLRGPIRYRRVKVVIQGKKTKVVAATSVERGRRQAEVQRERAALKAVTSDPSASLRAGEWRVTGKERQRDSASRAGAARSARTKASAMPVAYREIPEWARGLLLPGDLGTATLPLSGQGRRTPRPVPFAFRRRR